MKRKHLLTLFKSILLTTLITFGVLISGGTPAETSQTIDRTILPIQPPEYKAITELDARNVTSPPPFDVKAPEGAPNVVVVLIDDIGFGATSTFGGAIQTPTFDRLADSGLRFNIFRVKKHKSLTWKQPKK